MSVEDPCIISRAVSGAVASKEQCPAIPYTPEEYAKEVRRARDADAAERALASQDLLEGLRAFRQSRHGAFQGR